MSRDHFQPIMYRCHWLVKDKLVKAETTTAGRLTKAAGLRSDEGIVNQSDVFFI